MEKCNFRPENGRHFPGSKSFEVKFADKVPINPNNVPTKLCWNNQNTVEEKYKNAISDLRIAAISLGLGRLRSNLWTECSLPLAMCLPSFVRITKTNLEKSEKMLFQTLKNGRHFKRSRSLSLAISLPSFVGITKIDRRKSAKM